MNFIGAFMYGGDSNGVGGMVGPGVTVVEAGHPQAFARTLES